VPAGPGRRILVFSLGALSSGIPPDWAATDDRSGVAYVRELSAAAAEAAVQRVQGVKRPGDIAVVSVHWGSNWGYLVPREQTRFAHALVDGGVDLVHGHSSHHPRPVELYRDRLILSGCGDFIDDYEGISGYEEYRDDLRLGYLVSVAADTGRPTGMRMFPWQARRMRLEPAADQDRAWLRATLGRISHGVHIGTGADGALGVVAGFAGADP
jgi:poly-gamma-glutamate synthesis protein (capsule biosynthesis protein)